MTPYKSEDEKSPRARIGDEAYEITQNAATEPPFTGIYDNSLKFIPYDQMEAEGYGEYMEQL